MKTKELVAKELDALYLKILAELQQNARMPIVEIGKRVGLSAPAVAERIKRLEDEGYIKGYQTVIDYDKLGLTIPVFINFKATAPVNHKEMAQIFDALPEIAEWYSVTGPHCAVLKVLVASMKELDSFLEYLQSYGETSTSVILSTNSKTTPIDRR